MNRGMIVKVIIVLSLIVVAVIGYRMLNGSPATAKIPGA